MSSDSGLHAGSKRRFSEWVDNNGKDVLSSKGAKRHNPQVMLYRRCIQKCCKINDLVTAMGAYNESIERKVKMEAQSFYCLLNLCDGLGQREIHAGTPKSTTAASEKQDAPFVSLEDRQAFAAKLKSRMDELSIPLVETAYTALVKLYTRSGRTAEAEHLISEAESTQQCRVKVRLYTPLLRSHCEKGDMIAALKLWARLSSEQPQLSLTEREYRELIKCATVSGCDVVMERVLSELAEDVLVPSIDSTKNICAWFQSKRLSTDSNPINAEASTILPTIQNPHAELVTNMGPVTLDENGWEISGTCSIDTKTGQLTTGCLKGEFLRPIQVSNKVWDEMISLINKIVNDGNLENHQSPFQGGHKGKKRKLDPNFMKTRRKHWTEFKDYLSDRAKTRGVDIVIDGANVGYFKQNYPGAPRHVNYDQVNKIVEHFRKEKKSVLLAMHSRHFEKNFMPKKYQPLIQSWLDNGILYRTPHGMDDDWFWMYAALSSGRATLVVTNDQMRDHHFQTLARRSFVRWQERHQVKFSFDWDSSVQLQRYTFEFPDIYSRRVQRVANGLVVPHTMIGDEDRFLDGTQVIDKDAPAEETYVCIRPVDGKSESEPS